MRVTQMIYAHLTLERVADQSTARSFHLKTGF